MIFNRIKFRLFLYKIESNFANKKRLNYIKRRLLNIYIKNGDLSKAIKEAEFLYNHDENPDWYFVLKNLFLINNQLIEANNLEEKSDNYRNDIVSSINVMNRAMPDSYKLDFIENYVRSKGGIPSLICIENKGRRLSNKSRTEIELLKNSKLYIQDRKDWCQGNNAPEYVKSLYTIDERENISKLFECGSPIIKATKVVLSDFDNGFVSVKNGQRTTTGQPENAVKRVLLFGSSTTCSFGVKDSDTIASQLQAYFNNHYGDVIVENHGSHGMNLLLAVNNLVQTEIKPGDIVVFFDFIEFSDLNNTSIESIDLNEIDRGNKFFLDLDKVNCHFSPLGNEMMANEVGDRILSKLINLPTVQSVCALTANQNESDFYKILDNFKYFLFKHVARTLESCEMKSYLSLLEQYIPDDGVNVGSIAVNCNPITNGHMHLIDYASKKVDKLFIFVIEEDLSFFKFKDRLQLVHGSSRHLENVTVLPGGKFICTELTYPDYFDKDAKSEVVADASMEAWFFCEFIAKKLNISKIFLGDEPTCKVTKQYNQKMQELLPEYNIEVDIIERISTGGRVISASTVRKLLEERDFDSIKPLVPTTTYEFLMANY
ncbi:citrate lyase ligase [Vibrio owensii]|uniref:citrate lyase ligase n=1 Tax=Vibrio owensii TaxID=696485 RepID=UPI0018F171BA